MEDIASFLGSHPPFDGVVADELARVAAVTEIEAFPGGKTIFSEGTGPVEYLRVVRAGSVEVLHEGQVLDLLGPGELFGHASMLSGLPTGFERAPLRTRAAIAFPLTSSAHYWPARISSGSSPAPSSAAVPPPGRSVHHRSTRSSAASRR